VSVVVSRADWRGMRDEGADRARLARERMAMRVDFMVVEMRFGFLKTVSRGLDELLSWTLART
jgi:hypothetical protein